MACAAPSLCQKYAKWLEDAENALHALNLGRAVELVQHDGKIVRFSAADRGTLQRYVEDLRCKVDACNGVTSASRRRFVGIIPA